MTVRLAQAIGMGRIREMAARFGLERGLGDNLASALGSNEVTLLQLTTAYAMLVNGGKRIEPAMIERIQDRHGRTVLRRDARPCPECQNVAWTGQPAPLLPDQREQVVDPARSYQMVNMLKGVVERGTATRALEIGKPVAGKTGTTDDIRDAWFVGFTPDLVVGVYVGFDQPKTPGLRRAGRERRAADLRAVHGGGAQGPAGDAVPRAARGPPGPGRCRYRAAGPARARRPRSSRRTCPAPSRPRQHRAAHRPRPAMRPASPRPRPASSARRPAGCIEAAPAARRLSVCGQRAIGGCPNGVPRQPQTVSDHARRDQPSRRGDRAGRRPAEEASLTGTARSNAWTS